MAWSIAWGWRRRRIRVLDAIWICHSHDDDSRGSMRRVGVLLLHGVREAFGDHAREARRGLVA
jgi:hypothetical protein